MDDLTRIRRWNWAVRITVAVSMCLALCGTLMYLRPPPPGVDVLVTSARLTSGMASSSAVHTVAVPQAAVPADALSADADIPPRWVGADIEAGTVLTESNVAGSADSRALADDEAQVTIELPVDQLTRVSAGDTVQLWASDSFCADEQRKCPATLLADGIRIASISDHDSGPLADSPTQSVSIIMKADETERIVGHVTSDIITLVLRSPSG